MKKSERQKKFVQENINLFRCPTCQAPMARVVDNSIVCQNGHQIDFNRHGYLHFLTGAAETEYGREMFCARRQLLESGLFTPIIKEVAGVLPDKPLRLLDVGTGEGTPLKQLVSLRKNDRDVMVGFDISKPGITLATQLGLRAFFCVADLRKLPFNDQRFDALVELFSPSDYREFNRVLAPGGCLIKVVPNSGYLAELRQLLYGKNQAKSHYDNQRVVNLFKQHYPNCQLKQVKYQFTIPSGQQEALVEMTPLHWGKGARQLTAKELMTLTRVTVDVSLLIAKKGE
ncbi:methyltransferase domain-containing protein [Limosilactobacillus viscerum]|uniref:methyltransferase domain-containing protein n=1 Tax=Limosilactobacillus viscerum TaxID=2993450 RepID=UPI0024B90A06|nr:methyltransferase domain-containing protein [Limosilactobacillus viscerum]